MTMLRPLLPLLLLIPFIALSGATHAAVPVARPAKAEALRKQQAAVARPFTVAVQSCVRTGNRMVC